MILSDAIKVKYKIDTKGRNTVEMAKLLRDWGVRGYLYSVNPRSIVMAVLPEDKEHNRKAGGVNDTEEKIRKDEI